jgi:hypothetical protein
MCPCVGQKVDNTNHQEEAQEMVIIGQGRRKELPKELYWGSVQAVDTVYQPRIETEAWGGGGGLSVISPVPTMSYESFALVGTFTVLKTNSY